MNTRRGLIAIGGLTLLAVMALTVVNVFTPAASGPAGSSYATTPTGASALATLLARSGHPVRRVRGALTGTDLSADATAFMLDPSQLSACDLAGLRRFVTAGGTLAAGGPNPMAWLARLMADPPAWKASGPELSQPLVPGTAITEVHSVGAGSWSDPRATLPVLGSPGDSLLTTARLGRGRLFLLADISPLENQLLDRADNAELGLTLAGTTGRPVLFAEGVHGYGTATGLAALPPRWKWALVGLLIAALATVAARFRRLGPPEPEPRRPLPPRRAHVDALGLALARTRQPGRAIAPVREQARELARERAGLAPDTPADALPALAAALGLEPDEAAALGPAELGSDEVLAAGRALAKLTGPRA
jgi:Domain of unknown function (DUF4350)